MENEKWGLDHDMIGGVREEEAVGTEGRGRVGDRGGGTGPLDTGGVGT